MGQKSIIEKIEELVHSWESAPIQEKDIVYLFVEIGKFLEQGVPKDQFLYLRFFRNWTGHNKIHDTRVIDEFIPSIKSGHPSSLNENDGFKQIFQGLVSELTGFLKINKIDPMVIDKKQEEFLNGLIEILAEQPLVLEKVKEYIVIEPNSRTFVVTDTM